MPTPPKPTMLRVLDGETVTVPPTPPARPPTPRWKDIGDERIRRRAKAEYHRLCDLLDRVGILASVDLMTIHAAAVAYASWQVAMMDEDDTAARSWMRLASQLASKLGLSPLDRSRLVFPSQLPKMHSHVLDEPGINM